MHQGTLFQISQKNHEKSDLVDFDSVPPCLPQTEQGTARRCDRTPWPQAVIEGPPPDTHWRFAEGWGPQSGAAEAVEQALSTGCILHISLRLSQIPADP